jgi:hypothetical protein
MTKLTKPVAREVSAPPGWDPMVVTLAAEGIWLRPKGTWKSGAFLLPYAVAYQRAAALKAQFDPSPRRRRRA